MTDLCPLWLWPQRANDKLWILNEEDKAKNKKEKIECGITNKERTFFFTLVLRNPLKRNIHNGRVVRSLSNQQIPYSWYRLQYIFVLFLFFERRETHDDDDDELYCSRALAKDESRSHTHKQRRRVFTARAVWLRMAMLSLCLRGRELVSLSWIAHNTQ